MEVAAGAEREVTVAVVSWNTRELLRRCLTSLQAAAATGRAEVWVLDNASDDASAEMVAAAFPWVRLIASERNLGFGAAVNAVADQSAREAGRGVSPWIATANADIALEPPALEAMLKAGAADPRAGIIAPRLILEDASTQHSVHPFPTVASAIAFNLGVGRVRPALAERLTFDGHWDLSSSRVVDWAHGAFLLLRRSAFDAVGGFDSDQFLYAEDLDIAWRMSQAGWHTRYEPAAEVQHAHGAAITQLYGDTRDVQAQRSAYRWMLRRQGPLAMRTHALINTVGAGARALGAIPAAVRGDDEAGLHAWRLRRDARIHLAGLTTSRRRLEQHR